MSTNKPMDANQLKAAFGKSVRDHWILFLVEGIVLFMLGFLAIVIPPLATRDGFIERPDGPALLREAHNRGCAIDLADVTYYVCHETVVRATMTRWVEA
jgi:hypothetical protein